MMVAVQVRYSVEAGVLLLGLCVLVGPLLAARGRIPGLIGLVGAGACSVRTCSRGCNPAASSPPSAPPACST